MVLVSIPPGSSPYPETNGPQEETIPHFDVIEVSVAVHGCLYIGLAGHRPDSVLLSGLDAGISNATASQRLRFMYPSTEN